MRKTSFLIANLVLIIGFIFWIVYHSSASITVKYLDMSTMLQEHGVLEHDLDGVLGKLFEETGKEMNIPDQFQVNGPYDPKKINLYVLNFEKLRSLDGINKIGFFQPDEFINLCENNFVAIPPNVVVIDHYFFSSLLLECFNDQMTIAQLLTGSTTTTKLDTERAVAQEAVRVNAINTYLRLANFDIFINKKHDEFSINRFGEIAGRSLERIDPNLQGPYFIYFLPLIAHELAHLKNNVPGPYRASKIEGFVADYYSYFRKTQQLEEDKADAIAIAIIKKYLERQFDDSEDKGQFYYRIQPLMSFCAYMRDLLLYETYEGFRGQEAKDLLVTIVQKEMREFDGSERNRFIDYERVKEAHINLAPLMTGEEFALTMSRLKSKGGSLAHKHIFLRAMAIEDCVNKYFPTSVLEAYVGMLSAYEEGNTDSLFVLESLPGMNVTFEQMTRGLSGTLEGFKKAVNYDRNYAEIALLKNGYGYMELIGSRQNIQTARLVIRFRDPNDAIIFEDLAFFMRFVGNCFDDERKGFELALELHARLKENRSYLPSFRVQKENKQFRAHYINESNYVIVEVSAAS